MMERLLDHALRFAKAYSVLVLGVVATLLSWFVTGELDKGELAGGVFALLSAVLVSQVPNRPRWTRQRPSRIASSGHVRLP
jgi:membrane protein CcdC involved in cytochrome C biogenesis